MLSNNFAVGAGLTYNTTNIDNYYNSSSSNTVNYTSSSIGLAPFVNYYKAINGSENFYFYAQAKIGFASTSSKFSNSSSVSGTDVSFAISPNFVYFPTKLIGVELGFTGLGYTLSNPEGDNNNSSTFVLGANYFSPRIGLNFWF